MKFASATFGIGGGIALNASLPDYASASGRGTVEQLCDCLVTARQTTRSTGNTIVKNQAERAFPSCVETVC